MDLVEKLIWIVCIVSLVCFFGIVSAEAEIPKGDKYETLGIRHDTKPDVCLFEPNPTHVDWDYWKSVEHESWRAILEWQIQMSEFLPEGDWSMFIHPTVPYHEHWNKTPDDYRHCTIFLTYEYTNEDSDSGALGKTAIDFRKSSHKFTYIVVYLYAEERNKIVIDLENTERDENGVIRFNLDLTKKPIPLNSIHNIVLHELGHGLGLGHYISSVNNDRSVMVRSLDPFDEEQLFEIQISDKFMLSKIYGINGYYKPHPHFIYDLCVFTEKGTKSNGCY